MLLPNLPFTVLDTETTGFVPKVHRIIEFASMQAKDGIVIDEYECLIGIPTDIPPEVIMLTRITNEAIKEKPPFAEHAETIQAHIGTDTFIIGQNIQFDIRMLKGEGIDLTDRPQLDTSMLASLVFPELASYSLPYMSQVLNLDHTPVHRALGDVKATLELLSKCWMRLYELDLPRYEQLQAVMQRAPHAYKTLFNLIPKPINTSKPVWLNCAIPSQSAATEAPTTTIPLPKIEGVHLLDEPLDPSFLRRCIMTALEQKQPTFVAVKNVHIARQALEDLDGVLCIEPPSHLLNESQIAPFIAKEEFTTDEATLAVKLQWYAPRTKADIPLHGDEKDLWYSLLACDEQSPEYTDQFAQKATVKVMNHWQLLRGIDTSTTNSTVLEYAQNTQVIIDDATSLEDTATNAFGWHCDCHKLRIASENIPELQQFVDVLQMSIERIRNGLDVCYLTPTLVQGGDIAELRQQISDIQALPAVQGSAGVLANLVDLYKILDPTTVRDRIVWIELGRDDRQLLTSAPKSIASVLQEKLYDRFAVHLLIPPGAIGHLAEVLPASQDVVHTAVDFAPYVHIVYDGDGSPEDVFTNPPAGKTVVLVSGRRRIEDIFIKYTEALEQAGVTLLSQGFSGGTSRMQAEFTAQNGPTIMVMSAFLFETLDLAPNTIDQLFIESIPFDHPNHTVVSKRAETYGNAFMDYSLVRCENRLYRIARVFAQASHKDALITLYDKRIGTKRYGQHVWDYLEQVVGTADTANSTDDQPNVDDKNRKEPGGMQLGMF